MTSQVRGDLMLCDKTYQHDLDARPLCEQQYILIRTISDKANESAHVSLQDFSMKVASHYASGVIQEILKLYE